MAALDDAADAGDVHPRLVATCWSTAGDVGPMDEDQRSPFPIEDRIREAAAAGYTGMGILHTDLAESRERLGGYGRLRDMLAGHGIIDVEVEWLADWYATGPARAASDAIRAELLRAAYEPMPMDNVRTLSRARQLIDEAGHPAGGLMIDLWHMSRGSAGLDEIASLPGRYVTAVELGDADAQVKGTLIEDMWYNRRLCGAGDQDVTGFIQAVAATGYSGPWGIEVIAEDFRQLDLHTQATRSHDTTLEALKRALPPRTARHSPAARAGHSRL